MTLILVFLTVCLSRSFYKSSNVLSYVDPKEIDLQVKKEKSINSSIFIGESEKDDQSLNSNSIEETVEHCKKCEKFRFKRSHHCSICKTCVDKFDHHCFILNNCIGKKNYHHFISYLFLVTCLSGYILLLSTLVIYEYKKDMKQVI